MNLISLCSSTILLCVLLTTFKKKNYIGKIIIIYILILFVVKQFNNTFINLSSYYQVISYLNTKNNIIIIFIFLSMFLLNGFKNLNLNKIVHIITILLLYEYNYSNNINDLAFLYLEKSENTLNTNLLNGIMLIHPIFLYIYYTYVLYYIFYKTNKLKYLNKRNFLLYSSKKFFTTTSLIVILSLLLGCWWAEQELSWGGWWSWDLVELIALNYLVIKLVLIHKFKKYNVVTLYKNTYVLLCVLVVFMSIVRFNIINSIHNFISSENSNQYYIYMLLVMLTCLIVYINNFILKENKFNRIKNIYNTILLSFLLSFLLSLSYIIFFKKNVQIKDLYILIMLFLVVVYFKKNSIIFDKYITKIFIVIPIVFLNKTVTLINYILLCNIYFYVMFNYNGIFKRKNFHVILFFLFFICLKQVYLFSPESTNFTNNSVVEIYKNTCIYVINIVFTNLDFLKSNILILKKIQQNNGVFFDDQNKFIFEKKIILCENYLKEIYNYNNQSFLNTNMLFLFFLFLFFLFLFFLFLFLKKKKIQY